MLDQEKATKLYKVTDVLDQLTDYLIPDDREKLLNDLDVQIVDGANSLGTDSLVKGKREKRGREKESEKKRRTCHISYLCYISYFW